MINRMFMMYVFSVKNKNGSSCSARFAAMKINYAFIAFNVDLSCYKLATFNIN